MVVDFGVIADARALLEGCAGAAGRRAGGSPGTRCVLFDFDGPICRLFPDDSSMPLANELRDLVAAFGRSDLLVGDERTHKDPHLVLRAVHRARSARGAAGIGGKDPDVSALVEKLEARVTEGEVAAAGTAWPTPLAGNLIRRLAGRGLRLAVVTNNSPRAAERYLREHHLREYFEVIHGRTADPDLMKPHPDVLHRALRSLELTPDEAVMIGDTATDVMAAQRAGVRFIGYGRNAEKREPLRRARARIVLGSYAPLLDEAQEGDAHGSGECVVGEATGSRRGG